MNRFTEFPRPKFGHNKWKKNGRRPADPIERPLRFTEIAPLRLKNFVVGKGNAINSVTCLPEMMKLFECLAKNEHDQKQCGSDVEAFQKCHLMHLNTIAAEKAMKNNVAYAPDAKELSREQLNYLLRRHPQKIDK